MSFNGASKLKTDFWEPGPPWEYWFAWYPVRVKGKWVWFKEIYRKYNWARSTEQPFGSVYDYGDIFDVLKND